MSREIVINKYEGNTVYSVNVIDSYGTEHHIGYYSHYSEMHDIEDLARGIWENEVKPEENLLSNAIHEMIKHEEESGIRYTDSRGNHRDGLD